MIPSPGVHIFETYYPAGYTAGLYDHEGFVSRIAWFPTLDKARAYAGILKSIARLNAQSTRRQPASTGDA